METNKLMKRNKYLVKFTVPSVFGIGGLFYSFPDITFDEGTTPNRIFELICQVAIGDVKTSKGVEVPFTLLDFSIITILDSSFTET